MNENNQHEILYLIYLHMIGKNDQIFNKLVHMHGLQYHKPQKSYPYQSYDLIEQLLNAKVVPHKLLFFSLILLLTVIFVFVQKLNN